MVTTRAVGIPGKIVKGWLGLVGGLFGKADPPPAASAEIEVDMSESQRDPRQISLATAYRKLSWVYTSINELAKAVMVVPPQVRQRKPDGREEIITAGHNLVRILDAPNEILSWSDLMEAVIWNLYLHGFAVIEQVKVGGKTVSLFPLRSAYCSIKGDPRNLISYVEYTVNNRTEKIPRENLIYFKIYNPESDVMGFSPLESAKHPVNADHDAQVHIDKAFDNDCTPGFLMETDQNLDQTFISRFYRQLDQRMRGPNRAKKPLLLWGGVKAKQISQSLRDMDFIELRKMNREEIMGVFGVPPVKAGLLQYANYANARSQDKFFRNNTIAPLLARIYGAFNRQWVRVEYGPLLTVDPDMSVVLVDDDDKSVQRTAAIQTWSADLITRDEAREQCGLKPVGPMRGGDKFRSEMMVSPTSPSATAQSASARTQGSPSNLASSKPWERKAMTADDDSALWKAIDSVATRHEGAWVGLFEDVFRKQRDDVLDLFDREFGSRKEGAIRKDVEDDARRVDAGLVEVLNRVTDDDFSRISILLRQAVADGGTSATEVIGFDSGFDVFNPEVSNWVDKRGAKLVQFVNETTRSGIRDLINEKVREGAGVKEIRDAITEKFEADLSPENRPAVIARTETIAAANYGTVQSYKQTGVVKRKRWLATVDARTRDTHASANGQTVGIDDPFVVGGDKLLFPGDSSLGADAAEICNCRCTVTPVFTAS